MYQRIGDLREDKDLTQSQIAGLLHCSQRIYSNYKRGDADIRTHILKIGAVSPNQCGLFAGADQRENALSAQSKREKRQRIRRRPLVSFC